MINKIQKIREVIEKRYEYWKEKESNSHSIESEIRMSECQHLLLMLNSLQEEPVSEDFEIALANEWKGYNDRGAATVDALEDNTQKLAFAKGFYRGSNWKEQQMIANAIDAEVLENYDGKVIKYDETILDKKLSNCEVFDKVKLIIIKEE